MDPNGSLQSPSTTIVVPPQELHRARRAQRRERLKRKKSEAKEKSENLKIKSEDKEIFDKLFAVKPPKVGQEVGSAGSLGVGNGEIALYWLYNFTNFSFKIFYL